MGKVEGEGVFLAGGGTARAAEPALPLQGHDRDGGEERLFLPTFLMKSTFCQDRLGTSLQEGLFMNLTPC
jgi:hypothetical protein